MKKYARNGQKRGIESFAGKVEKFRKYLSERRLTKRGGDMLQTYYTLQVMEKHGKLKPLN